MCQNELGLSLNEAKLNNLCSHYKDTYDIHYATIKQRDSLFYALLVVLSLFSLQVTSTDFVNGMLGSALDKQLGINIDSDSNIFSTLLWFLLFGFSSRYYQTVIQIERQYSYMHHLEQILNNIYTEINVFTREGRSYLSEYPLFSNWIWFLYTVAFPSIVLMCITIRIKWEINSIQNIDLILMPSLVSYFFVGTSTILYIGKLHGVSALKFLKKIHYYSVHWMNKK